MSQLRRALSSLAGHSLVFFGGKGGVGKTTLASLAALTFAETRRTILFSSDPASNLPDLFTSGVPNVEVAPFASEALYRSFLDQHLASILEVADRGTYLDREEVERFFRLAVPGIDELMAWLEIDRLVEEANGAIVVVDTAPTGHTLRMLASSGHFEEMTAAFEAMQQKHRELVEQLTRRTFRDAIDEFIAGFRERTERARRRLADEKQSAFVPVTLAEEWVVAQTARLMSEVRSHGTHIPFVILNQATSDCDCSLCRERAENEKKAEAKLGRMVRAPAACTPLDSIEQLRNYLRGADAPVRTPGRAGSIEHEARRPRGADALVRPPGRAGMIEHEAKGTKLQAREVDRTQPMTLQLANERLVFFAGKGGVGKSSCAVSVALQSCAEKPDDRFILISVDPAESLTDAFAGSKPPPNLTVETIDTREKWSRLRDSLGDEIRQAVDALTPRGMTLAHDAEIIDQLLDLAPPGADELFGVMRIADLLADESVARILVDTAPTGHFLRLVDLPATAGEWVREFMRVLLRYKELIPPGSLAEKLIESSKALHRFGDALKHDSSVVLVCRAERIVMAETARLRQALDSRSIAVGATIVNSVTPANDCSCDRQRRTEELKIAAAVPSAVTIERRTPPPRSLDDLRSLVPMRHTPST